MTNNEKASFFTELDQIIKDGLKNDAFYIKQIDVLSNLRKEARTRWSDADDKQNAFFQQIRNEKRYLNKNDEEKASFEELNNTMAEENKKIAILDRCIKFYKDQEKLMFDVCAYSIMFYVFEHSKNTRDFNIFKDFCDYDLEKREYKQPICFSIYDGYFYFYHKLSNRDFISLPVRSFEPVSIEDMHEKIGQYNQDDKESPFYYQHLWQSQYNERIKPLKKYDFVYRLCEKVMALENKQTQDLKQFQEKQSDAKKKLNVLGL